jgi:SNF2 family DNA or RNA helicase
MSKEVKSRSSKNLKELKINLVRDQEAHAKSLIEILKKSVVAFDMSMMGAGKTYVASEVAIRYNFKHIVVVCPASVMGKWESMKKYIKPKDALRQDSKSLGVGSNSLELNSSSSIFILSYEALRSTTPRIMSASGKSAKRLLSHGLLYRSDPNPFGSLKISSKNLLNKEHDSKNLDEQEQSSKTEFYPSEELISMIKEGCLFIFDEAQKVKNKNASWLAVKTISETILGRGPQGTSTFGPKSRFLMLSGTPMDKEEHAVNLMEMMGFIQSRKLFTTGMSPVLNLKSEKSDNNPLKSEALLLPGLPKISNLRMESGNNSGLKLIGAQELIDFCKNINKEKTERIVRVLSNTQNFGLKDGSVREGVIHLCYTLFQEIIKKEITSSMVPPKPVDTITGKEITLDAKNGYYKFSDSVSDMEAEKELTAGLHTLDRMMKTAAFRPGGSIPKVKPVGSEDLGNTFLNKFGLTKPLKQIETGKVPIFIRKAKETLKLVPNSKVCIFVNYLENLANIAKALSEYNPILMYGSVPKEKRQAIIDLFQEPNLKYRVYISILSVSATGIDLDDQSVGCDIAKKHGTKSSKERRTLVLKDGCFPRYAFASPGFKIDELHQLTRRFYRVNTKSNAVFRFVYAKGHNEVGLLNNLARKSGVMKDTLEKQVESGVKFPGEYSNEIESFIA